jgi:signal transduction histidine kinase
VTGVQTCALPIYVPGDGMGLAYVRALVRQLGGKAWCESEPGAGTKLHFTVPKKAAG